MWILVVGPPRDRPMALSSQAELRLHADERGRSFRLRMPTPNQFHLVSRKKITPQALLRPAIESVKRCLPRTKLFWNIAPGASHAQFPQDSLHDLTAIFRIITALGFHYGK